MNNKYLAYTYVSLKTLISFKALLIGFIFNLCIALVIAIYLLTFKSDVTMPSFTSVNDGLVTSLTLVKWFAIILVFFLFSNVSIMMQSVFEDRDSKVSEIISTSITEKHYLFGKLVTSFIYMVILFVSAFLAVFLASIIYSIFSSNFNLYTNIISPIFSSISLKGILFVLGCACIGLIMVATSIVFTLGLAIKTKNLVEAAPLSLLILIPYFILFALFIFLPMDTPDLWLLISSIMMFIPLFSPVFILIYVILVGFNFLSILAILLTILYGFILFIGVSNIYQYAFYTREKLSLRGLFQLAIRRSLG